MAKKSLKIVRRAMLVIPKLYYPAIEFVTDKNTLPTSCSKFFDIHQLIRRTFIAGESESYQCHSFLLSFSRFHSAIARCTQHHDSLTNIWT